MLPDMPFGEVNFPLSRAFWDGDEDGAFEGAEEKKKVEVHVSDEKKFAPGYKMVLAEGLLAVDFIGGYLRENKLRPFGKVFVEGPGEASQTKKCVLELYSPSEGVLIGCCTSFFQVDVANDVFLQLHARFGSDWNFLGLVSRSVVDYASPNGGGGDDDDSATFVLRQLSSTRGGAGAASGSATAAAAARLEVPNYVTGLVAAGLQTAEAMKRPGQIFCIYSEVPDLDRASFAELRASLEASVLGRDGPWPAKISSISSSVDRGNLYC